MDELQLQILLTVFGLVLLFVWKRKHDARQDSPAVHLPGPRQFFLGGYLNILELANRKKTMKVLWRWTREYVPLARSNFGPISVVMMNSAPAMQKLLGSSDINHLGKSFIYEAIKPFHGVDGLVSSKGQKWKTRRKVLSKIMEYKSLIGYTHILNKESSRLVLQLKGLFEHDPAPKEIQLQLKELALSCISEAALGIGMLTDSSKHDFQEYIKATNRFMQIGAIRITNPWLLFYPIWRLHPLYREVNGLIVLINNTIKTLIAQYEERKEEESCDELQNPKGKTLLECLLDEGLPFDGILEETATMIIAGYDTTAMTLQLLLFLLALNPEHQELCRQEVDSVMDDDELCPNGVLTSEGIQTLKHLERCLYETLRFFPPVFIMMRKIDAPLKLDDKLELEAGTNIVMLPYGLHMNPEYFPNPEVFNPDNFLPEEVQKRHPYAFIPFSAGPRKCIGYKFAIMELLTTSAKILHHFIIHTTDKLENLNFLPEVTLTLEKPIKFSLELRRNDSNL